MRNTAALIEGLETESAQHFACVLPVAFENTSIMINSTDENRLELLNDAVQQGGIPVGLLVADKEGFGALAVKTRIFPEHLEHGPNESAQAFMEKIMGEMKALLESHAA